MNFIKSVYERIDSFLEDTSKPRLLRAITLLGAGIITAAIALGIVYGLGWIVVYCLGEDLAIGTLITCIFIIISYLTVPASKKEN